jgi:acyl carrier protein
MSDIESEITSLIRATRRVDTDQVSGYTLFGGELAADPLDSVALIMAIEDRFEIDIPDEDAGEIRTVKQMAEYVMFAVAANEAFHGRSPVRLQLPRSA